jgi:hypothetical protein
LRARISTARETTPTAQGPPGHRDALEQPPQVVLEDDDHDQHHDGEEALEEPDRELQLDLLGQQVQAQNDTKADEREPRPGAPQPHEHGPEQERDDGDVDQVAKRELREGVHQRNPPGGSRGPCS